MSRLITQGLGPIVKVGKPSSSQPGHTDQLMGEKTIGGPLAGKDVRLYLDANTLAHLLDVARTSNVRRCQINGVGVKIRLWCTASGHQYETWQIVGLQPVPEDSPLLP